MAIKKLSTSDYIHHLGTRGTLGKKDADALVVRGFGVESDERADTKPVIDFLHALESRPCAPPYEKMKIAKGHAGPADDVGSKAEELAYTAFAAQPRALAGFQGSGQRFNARLTAGILRGKPELAVLGTSTKAYTLTFTLAEHQVRVAIPAHSTPRNSARLIAAAINADSQAIARSDDGSAFGSWTDAALAGVTAVAKGGTVFVTPDIHD